MCQGERSGKEDDSPCASDKGTDWKSGSRREHLNPLKYTHTHTFTSLYLDDEWRYKHTPQPVYSAVWRRLEDSTF